MDEKDTDWQQARWQLLRLGLTYDFPDTCLVILKRACRASKALLEEKSGENLETLLAKEPTELLDLIEATEKDLLEKTGILLPPFLLRKRESRVLQKLHDSFLARFLASQSDICATQN